MMMMDIHAAGAMEEGGIIFLWANAEMNRSTYLIPLKTRLSGRQVVDTSDPSKYCSGMDTDNCCSSGYYERGIQRAAVKISGVVCSECGF